MEAHIHTRAHTHTLTRAHTHTHTYISYIVERAQEPMPTKDRYAHEHTHIHTLTRAHTQTRIHTHISLTRTGAHAYQGSLCTHRRGH